MAPQTNKDDTDPIDRAVKDWSEENLDLPLVPMAVFGRISRIVSQQRQIFNERHNSVGLTFGSFDALATLRRSAMRGPITTTELADESMVSIGGASMRIDTLVKSGLVNRVRDENDRRVVHVSLTPAGRELIDSIFASHLEAQAALLSDLNSDERNQLNNLLRKLEMSILNHKEDARNLSSSRRDTN